MKKQAALTSRARRKPSAPQDTPIVRVTCPSCGFVCEHPDTDIWQCARCKRYEALADLRLMRPELFRHPVEEPGTFRRAGTSVTATEYPAMP